MEDNKKNEKLSVIVGLVVLVVVLGIGMIFMHSSNVKLNQDNDKYREQVQLLEKEIRNLKEEVQDENMVVSSNGKYSNIEEIDVNELEVKMDQKESFILVFTQTQCGHCIAYKPVFNKVLKKNDIQAFEVNLTNHTYKEREKINELVKFSGTPTTVVFVDGVEDNRYRIVGNASEDKIVEKLSNAGYIN